VELVTTSSRIRRTATVGCGAVAALAAAGTAQAQTVHAGAVPHAGPSATRQDAPGARLMKVRSVEATNSPDTYEGCDAGFFCLSVRYDPEVWDWWLEDATLHEGTGYSYSWGFCGSAILAAHPGCDAGIHAWANNTGDRVWLKEFKTGGKELCISNHTWNSNYEGIADDDYWVQITTNPNPC
jgi:hypothetical protein